MKQYLKLKDATHIVFPPEMMRDKKRAIKAWGEDGWVEHNINASDEPLLFKAELVDGKVVSNSSSEDTNTAALKTARHDAVKAVRVGIDPENFNINNLTPVQLKVMFGIGAPPTDAELGI